MQQKQNRKRIAITVALVACLASVAGLGTLAWLTAQDQTANVFTTGNFTDPGNEPKPDNPETDDKDEDKEENEGKPNTDGYLFETNWKENSKLMAGEPIAKNPNVGIGAEGDSAFVFIYVQNNTLSEAATAKGAAETKDAPYFTLEKQWAVADSSYVTVSTATDENGAAVQSAYTSGLFMYVEDNATATGVPTVLESSKVAGTDTYTGELFENVTMPANTNFDFYADSPQMNVFAFIYGYGGEASAAGEDGSAQAALVAAKTWADKIKAGTITVDQG